MSKVLELNPQLKTMDFAGAIRCVIDGYKITKLEWANKEVYGFLNPDTNFLTLHKADGRFYNWIINDGDLNGEDWIVI